MQTATLAAPARAALRFWVNFSDWGTLDGVNFLAGSLSYISGLVLWVTSISWVRRRFFEVRAGLLRCDSKPGRCRGASTGGPACGSDAGVSQGCPPADAPGRLPAAADTQVFYRFHVLCFLGFSLFAYMHYSGSWTYFLPSEPCA